MVTAVPILSAAWGECLERVVHVAGRCPDTPDLTAPDGPIRPGEDRLTCVERPELSIAVQRAPDEVVIQLAGEIDVLTVAELSIVVNELLADEPPNRIVLDMAGVTFCDSQGLGTLVVLSRKAQHAGSVLARVRSCGGEHSRIAA